MKLKSLGEIIAVRKLLLVVDGRQDLVEVALGKPQPSLQSSDFYCPYHSEAGKDKVMAILGKEASQAMQLAPGAIGVELAVVNKDSGGELFWEGNDQGNLDFPAPDWSEQ